MSSTIRTHLRGHHQEAWLKEVIEHELKNWPDAIQELAQLEGDTDNEIKNEHFTLAGLRCRVTEFVAGTDQVC